MQTLKKPKELKKHTSRDNFTGVLLGTNDLIEYTKFDGGFFESIFKDELGSTGVYKSDVQYKSSQSHNTELG